MDPRQNMNCKHRNPDPCTRRTTMSRLDDTQIANTHNHNQRHGFEKDWPNPMCQQHKQRSLLLGGVPRECLLQNELGQRAWHLLLQRLAGEPALDNSCSPPAPSLHAPAVPPHPIVWVDAVPALAGVIRHPAATSAQDAHVEVVIVVRLEGP